MKKIKYKILKANDPINKSHASIYIQYWSIDGRYII